ncbi:hypothetical protein LG634_24800 [Streptomyces bambusae]|uniref:hypothetical protein n=1 Tax=Streptomyces bambusae TaxID=1550616 RepID=UPI001CFE5543|nr:hypothetical protein [Streptomyces bambusae]MCB5168033.1 hypothetical protein [Streptomyces bambusae]
MSLPFSLADLNNDTSPYPSLITVYCDLCGQAVTADYIVTPGMTSAERLGVARAHLNTEGQWDCGAAGDLCPACKGDEPGMCPACDTAAIERCGVCGSCRCDRHDSCAPTAN